MKNQVLSIDQMQRLKELGVDTSDASANEYEVSEDEIYCGRSREVVTVDGCLTCYISKKKVFTLQDVIDILPNSIDNNVLTIRKNTNGVSISYEDTYTRSILSIFEKEDIIEAAYEMLVWCVKNGYVKNK
jgi:hypothetical protein